MKNSVIILLALICMAAAVFCPAQSPAPQPQVLVTGIVKSFEKPFSSMNYQLKVQTGTASKILETSDVLEMTVAMNSTGSGAVTGTKTIPQKEYVYTLYLADDTKVFKGLVEANLTDVQAGIQVEITGTVEKHDPETKIDGYGVVDGKLVMKTVRSTQTQTATSIRILPDRTQDSQTNAAPGDKATSSPGATDEIAEWNNTVKQGTKGAYLAFVLAHPKSDRLQVRRGTIRARYWYKVAMPFAQKAEKPESGVLVTVEGLNVLRNVSLKEAKDSDLLNVKPATKGEQVQAGGRTFNWTCLEVTHGGCVVDDDLIAPKDSAGAKIISSGDGKELLAWDLTDAKAIAEPTDKPTYIDLPANQAWLPKP